MVMNTCIIDIYEKWSCEGVGVVGFTRIRGDDCVYLNIDF